MAGGLRSCPLASLQCKDRLNLSILALPPRTSVNVMEDTGLNERDNQFRLCRGDGYGIPGLVSMERKLVCCDTKAQFYEPHDKRAMKAAGGPGSREHPIEVVLDLPPPPPPYFDVIQSS
jgi:hypothetical protein